MVRHDWTLEELQQLYDQPLVDLIEQARVVHAAHHSPGEVQMCHLISVKTGGCSEDCKYCAQSSRYQTPIQATPMMEVEEVVTLATQAKEKGATRICLGAAWRQARPSGQFDRVVEMVRRVAEMGLEVCCTLGMLEEEQIHQLKEAGLYAYNHNLDSSEKFYKTIITTRTYQDRLETLGRVAKSGLSVCSGGIIGMGEEVVDRLGLLQTLTSLRPHPNSVPIGRLIPIPGTPLEGQAEPTAWELLRMVAVARIVLPHSVIRLAAGRLSLSQAELTLCLLAGANSLFIGDKLLTEAGANPAFEGDQALFETLGLRKRPADVRDHFLASRLEKREREGGGRSLIHRDPSLVDFASNDYLGLASSPEVAQEIEQRFAELTHGEGIRPVIGATGSRLLTGNQPYVEELEQVIAEFHGGESALLFNSGYAANTGLLSSLGSDRDAILIDSQVHASTWDGARLSPAKSYLFRHNDCDHLEKQLRRARAEREQLFIAVESLYSMEGDLAPLEELVALCRQYGAWLIVDEAHANGVLGAEGRGLVADLPRRDPILATLYTFGKGLGCHGAAVVGSSLLRRYLINFCRTFIYTTALPFHTLVALRTLYGRLGAMEEERRRLFRLIDGFELRVEACGLPIRTSRTPIQSIPIGTAEGALRMSERLRRGGLDVRAIRYPTVRKGSELLRISLHSFNELSEVDRLVELLLEEVEAISVA